MPLLMDEDLDELFGEHGDDPSLQMPSSTPKELLQHVDNLRLTGCSQRIAWSKTGCIATIDGDDHGVSTRQLFCNQGNGKWALSKPISIKGVSTLHFDYPIIHLSWNHQGNELAVFDSMGRVSIFSLLFTLSDFATPRKCVIDTDDPLSVVVGLIWLNSEKPHMFQESARREEGQWRISSTQQTPLGPHNPTSGMSALVTITRNGMIRLLLQGRDRTWQEAKTELDTYSVPADLLTHATMAVNKDSTLLVTTHTTDHQLRFYCVSIDFQRLSFKTQHLKIVTDCFPKGEDTGGPDGTGWYPNACLTHLDYFPQGPESRKGEPSLPFVLGSFTDVSDQHQNNGSHEPFSVVCRWELQSTKPKVHPNFENLSPKRSTASKQLAADITIKRLPDTFIPKIFIYVQQMRLSTILAIAYYDGTVEFRDRLTMDILPQNDIREEVFSLGQIGFEFVPDTPRLHVSLSPNFCAMASLNDSSEITLGILQPPAGSLDNALFGATAETLILHFTSACTSHGQYADDILSVMQLFSEHHPNDSIDDEFLSEVYRALDVRLDHAIEPQVEWLFKNLMIQKCLGMQLSLGYNGDHKPRMLRAKIAQGFLDIRLATLIITYSIKNVLAVAGTDARKADELHAITGSVAWTMSFMGFVVNELFNLNVFLHKDPSTDHAALQSHIHASNTPALPLLLISSSRCLLKYLCRSLHALAHEARSSAPTGHQRAAFHAIVSTLRESPVQVLHFEKLLLELDNGIRSAYQSSSLSDTDRKATEKRMLIGGEVPGVLMPAVRTLLGKGVEGLREEVDVAELHFADLTWLGLGGEQGVEGGWQDDDDNDGDGVGRLRREKIRVDAVRKVVLRPEARVRRCTRCFALMEDKPPATRNVGIMQSVRMCLCGDWWMHLESLGE